MSVITPKDCKQDFDPKLGTRVGGGIVQHVRVGTNNGALSTVTGRT